MLDLMRILAWLCCWCISKATLQIHRRCKSELTFTLFKKNLSAALPRKTFHFVSELVICKEGLYLPLILTCHCHIPLHKRPQTVLTFLQVCSRLIQIRSLVPTFTIVCVQEVGVAVGVNISFSGCLQHQKVLDGAGKHPTANLARTCAND